MKYVLRTRNNEILSYQGHVLVHSNKSELEYLVPGCRVIPIPDSYKNSPSLEIQQHPDFINVRFPLAQNMGQFI